MHDTVHNTLERLNLRYIEAARLADAGIFETILAQDFLCSNPDGVLLDRQEFLERTRGAQPMRALDIDDVRIRRFGDTALVHARTTYVLADGRQGTGRYTDAWTLIDGRWLAVAAHVTRLA